MRAAMPILLAAVVLLSCSIESAGLSVAPAPDVDAGPDAATAIEDAGPRPDVADGGALDATSDAGALDGGEEPSDAGGPLDAGGPECEDGVTSCSADGARVIGCVDGRPTTLACPAGCDPSAADCRTIPSCGLTVEGDLSPGVDQEVTLCGQGNDVAPEWTDQCQGGANGEDRLYRIVLDRRRTVRLDLRDYDGSAAIDTVLYVRAECDDAASQVACEDDIPCAEADPDFGCSGGVEYRQSILELELGPGTYFVAADSINRSGWRCGTVLLRYTWP